MKKVAITGITGQDGAYLSKLLLEKGYQVTGVVRSLNSANTERLKYLNILDKINLEECDLIDLSGVIKFINKHNPDEIYNLAAQSSVSLSFKQPISTIKFNTISVLNLLEAIRTLNNEIKLYQASSSEIYGRVNNLPITENTVIHPLSPYAIAKASSHWTVVNYRESYNLFACCGILFNHESFLRSDDFFIKKVIASALKIKAGIQDYLKVGNIDVKRDFGYAPDYVEIMWLMMQQKKADDYIICSGKSIKLRDIIYYIFDKSGLERDRIVVDKNLYRPLDIKDIYGDSSKAKNILKWEYNKNFYEILDLLIEEEIKNSKKFELI